MNRKKYIYQHEEWPDFIWDIETLSNLLADVRNTQGKLTGKMEALGFNLQNEAFLETLTADVLKSNEIEGIVLDKQAVRSSIAHRLGIDAGDLPPSDRNIEGIVDVMFDATGNFEEPLTKERLFGWHYAMFPMGRSGMYEITVGSWRNDSTGPMQVVSGAMDKEKIHYEAPPAELIDNEITVFLNWFNKKPDIDPVLKAGIAHLWFVTLHPFEDGNGRITRAITDMLLARSDGLPRRFYSMSSQIQKQRKSYYEILERTQKGKLDITEWINWFLNTLRKAIMNSEDTLSLITRKHRFWNTYGTRIKNERQKRLLNKLLEGFTGNLTTSRWAKIAKCSQDTALRDIQDLIDKGILVQSSSGGRSTKYKLAEAQQMYNGR
ncbi:MAG: cell filamentation protein Fic [Gemmatimonadaceae bacterium 4484_173]|nr:MAG: cell filamentation protein Fic [Gemmatimonadaceae bacterium 4484_173]